MKWFIQYASLSAKQQSVIDAICRDLERKHWVQGFAGSGKSLVMLHVIGRLISMRPGTRICFITYTNALTDLVAFGFQDLARSIGRPANVRVMTHTQFLDEREPYDFVFLDEVQDISLEDLESIKRRSKHLYLAGDPDQRIYRQGAASGEIERATTPRNHRLVEIFRLTRLLKAVAIAIFPKATIVASENAMKRVDVQVKIYCLPTARTEAHWVFSEAKNRARKGEPCAILIPTHDSIAEFAQHVAHSLGIAPPDKPIRRRDCPPDYRPFNRFWESREIPLRYFGNGFGKLEESFDHPIVFLMTYHSAKGLDFRNVFLPGLHSGATLASERALQEDPELARRLLFVAVTRCRENLFLSHSGKRRHEYLASLPPELAVDEIPDAHPRVIVDEDDIPF